MIALYISDKGITNPSENDYKEAIQNIGYYGNNIIPNKLDKLIDLGLSNSMSNDLFVNRIMFPLYDLSGNVVAFSGRIYNIKDSSKYINSKETSIFKKGN